MIAETFAPAVNGVVNSVKQVADQLAGRGHEPVVIAPSGADYRSARGHRIPVVTVPSMTLPGYRGLEVARPGGELATTVHDVLADLAPDVVHLASPAVLGGAAVHAARDLQLPSVAVWQTDLSAFARRYHLPLRTTFVWNRLRTVHNSAGLTLVPSSASAYQLRGQGIGPLALWQRGVDRELFHPFRRVAHDRSDELVVGFVGRLAPEKRVHLLAQVSTLPGVRLVVIGDGPKRRQLQKAMPRAHFAGQLTGEDLGRAVASLDLLVHPGADETFCQVVQEALCAGVPVIATAAGGPLDLVRHGENGLLWAGDDPAVLAAQVIGLRDDRAELARLAERTRPSVSFRTWSRVTDELLGHYATVTAARPAVDGVRVAG